MSLQIILVKLTSSVVAFIFKLISSSDSGISPFAVIFSSSYCFHKILFATSTELILQFDQYQLCTATDMWMIVLTIMQYLNIPIQQKDWIGIIDSDSSDKKFSKVVVTNRIDIHNIILFYIRVLGQ